MPNCNICHRLIDPGERVAFHNNGTCHFRCLPKEDREELEGLENLQKRTSREKEARQKKENQEESTKDKQEAMKRRQEILKEAQDRDKDRTPQEAEEDKNDRAQIDRLQKIQKMQKAKSDEEFKAAKEEFSKTINIPPTRTPEEILAEARARGDEKTAREAERLIKERKENEEDAEKIREMMRKKQAASESIPEENCAKCGKPASNFIDGKYYCPEHSFGEFEGGTRISGAPKYSQKYIRKEAEVGMKKYLCSKCGDIASIKHSGSWYCWVHDPEMKEKAVNATFSDISPPPPPRIIPVRAPAPMQFLPPPKTTPIISRPPPIVARQTSSREQPPIFQFSSIKEVKCPFCGSSRFLRVMARHGGETEYECENPACT